MNRLFNFVFFIIIGVTILTIGLISCGDSGTDPRDKEFFFPDTMVSFEQHVKPLLEAKCTIENGCHSPGNFNNPLQYAVLLNRNQLVLHRLSYNGELLIDVQNDPKTPEQSRFYLILAEGFPTPQDAMPPGRSLYTSELIGIRKWIREGAPE